MIISFRCNGAGGGAHRAWRSRATLATISPMWPPMGSCAKPSRRGTGGVGNRPDCRRPTDGRTAVRGVLGSRLGMLRPITRFSRLDQDSSTATRSTLGGFGSGDAAGWLRYSARAFLRSRAAFSCSSWAASNSATLRWACSAAFL